MTRRNIGSRKRPKQKKTRATRNSARRKLRRAAEAFESGRVDEARTIVTRAAAAHTTDTSLQLESGALFLRWGDPDAAKDCYLRVLQAQPHNDVALLGLGKTFFANGEFGRAMGCFELLVKRSSDSYEGHVMKGSAHRKLHQPIRAAEAFLAALTIDNCSHEASFLLGCAYQDQRLHEQAEQACRIATQSDPNIARYWYGLGHALASQGRAGEARDAYARSLLLGPEQVHVRWSHMMTTPTVYADEVELAEYRDAALSDLAALAQACVQSGDAHAQSISIAESFPLHYQGSDPLPLQRVYGTLVHAIMAQRFPDLVKSLPRRMLNAETKTQRVRVGLVSSHFRNHTVLKLFRSWLEQLDPERIETFVYQVGPLVDQNTKDLNESVEHFHYEPQDIEAIARRIRHDDLDVLVYPEVGMSRMVVKLAALRLAPVQAMSCGHPITSGLPTMDVMLSGELVEIPEADEHYTETLLRLPGLGLFLPSVQADGCEFERSDFGLSNGDVVYLSCQTLFKYLPTYDVVFPQIAKRVPRARFVFLRHRETAVNEVFEKRMERVFADHGLCAADYCTFLERQNQARFFALNSLSDVFLDTFEFSAGQTAFEAIAHGLAPVTCPSRLARGRFGAAALRKVGVTDTIASSVEDYIDIAAQLGTDVPRREELRQRLLDARHELTQDHEAMRAFEDFLASTVDR